MALHSRRDSNESTLRAAGLTLKRKDGATIVFVGEKGAKVMGDLAAAQPTDPALEGDEAAHDQADAADPAARDGAPGQAPRP